MGLTIPNSPKTALFWWRRLDSNQRRRKPTDLQSAPFSHSGTPPQRTDDYGGTSLLCQAFSGSTLIDASHFLKRKNPTFLGWGFYLAAVALQRDEEPDHYLLSHGYPHYH